jgi:phosphoribosyl 1,2-cyclic phosphate phosphodiesterase
MLGVEYPAGYLEDPRNRRNRSCLVLQGPEGNVIVDCPPELRIMAHAAGIHSIEGVIVTHTHADHIMGMDDLRSICMKTGKPVAIYTLPRYAEDIRRVFAYAFGDHPEGVFVPRFDLRELPRHPSTLRLAGLDIRTFVVEHGRFPVIGIRVGSFAYITDVSRIPDDVLPELQNLETFVVDAVRYRPHPNHFHFDRALEVAASIGAQRTILTHLSADYDFERTSADLPIGVELAYDGLRVSF